MCENVWNYWFKVKYLFLYKFSQPQQQEHECIQGYKGTRTWIQYVKKSKWTASYEFIYVSVGRKAPRAATNSVSRNSYPSSGRPQVSASLASKPSGPQALLNQWQVIDHCIHNFLKPSSILWKIWKWVCTHSDWFQNTMFCKRRRQEENKNIRCVSPAARTTLENVRALHPSILSPCTPLRSPLVLLCCRPIYPSAIVEGDGHQEHILLARRRLHSPGLYCTCSMFWHVRGSLSLSFFVQVQIEEHQGRGDPSTSRALGWGSRMGLPWLAVWQASPGPNKAWSSRSWTIITRDIQSFCPRRSFKSRISLTTTSRDKATLSSCKSVQSCWSLTSCFYVYQISHVSHISVVLSNLSTLQKLPWQFGLRPADLPCRTCNSLAIE